MQIVIGWTETEPELIDPGIPDGSHPVSPTFRDKPVAKTCMWLNHGTAADVQKAHKYAATCHDKDIKVLVYNGESDPLGRAKRELLPV